MVSKYKNRKIEFNPEWIDDESIITINDKYDEEICYDCAIMLQNYAIYKMKVKFCKKCKEKIIKYPEYEMILICSYDNIPNKFEKFSEISIEFFETLLENYKVASKFNKFVKAVITAKDGKILFAVRR